MAKQNRTKGRKPLTKTPPYCAETELTEVLRKLRAEEGLVVNVLSVAKLLLVARRESQSGSLTLHLHEGRVRKIRSEAFTTVE
jgi:hypothetical protein